MSFAVLLASLIPWQERIELFGMPLDVGIRQLLEEVSEVLKRIQGIGLGRLDDAVDCSAGLCSFRGVAEQPVLATDGKVADGALADVVGQSGVAVL